MLDPDKMMEDIKKEGNTGSSIKAAPAVRKAAKDHCVDLSQIKGTGKSGWITIKDYEEQTGKPVKFNVVEKAEYPMNHMKEDVENIGGMSFKRKRGGFDASNKKTLDIPENLKNTDLEYRWVNDVGGRVDKLKELGYQMVDSATLSKNENISVRRHVGISKEGTNIEAVLMATPKQWYKERQNQREQRRRKQEEGMFKNPKAAPGDDALDHNFYQKENSGIHGG